MSDRAQELANLGRRTAAAANLPTAGLDVDWHGFGAAVEEALRRGRSIPELHEYAQARPELHVLNAAGAEGTEAPRTNPRPVDPRRANGSVVQPRTAKDVLELRRDRVISRREARAYLGLPSRLPIVLFVVVAAAVFLLGVAVALRLLGL